MQNSVVKQKSYDFALRIIELYQINQGLCISAQGKRGDVGCRLGGTGKDSHKHSQNKFLQAARRKN